MDHKRHAILIANGDYPEGSGFAPLQCPVRDAEALHDVLADPAHGAFDSVTMLDNRPRSEVLIALKEALGRADRDDLIFIYFSGHGKTDEEGSLYLAAANTRADHLEATGIASQAVSDMIRRSNVSKKAVVLDCCYAGAFARNMKGGEAVAEDRMQEFARGSGTYMLMATGALSLAEEDPDHGLSILTRHLVDGLRGAADADRDGIVTVSELSKYIHREVSRSHAQRPTEGGLDIQGDVAISRSGIDADAELCGKVKLRLLEWVSMDAVTPAIFAQASEVLSRRWADLSSAERARREVLNRIVTDSVGSGQFMADWLGVVVPPEPPPEALPDGFGDARERLRRIDEERRGKNAAGKAPPARPEPSNASQGLQGLDDVRAADRAEATISPPPSDAFEDARARLKRIDEARGSGEAGRGSEAPTGTASRSGAGPWVAEAASSGRTGTGGDTPGQLASAGQVLACFFLIAAMGGGASLAIDVASNGRASLSETLGGYSVIVCLMLICWRFVRTRGKVMPVGDRARYAVIPPVLGLSPILLLYVVIGLSGGL